jgi:hypothetical protein
MRNHNTMLENNLKGLEETLDNERRNS